MTRISFLITHYNRTDELINCVNAIKAVAGDNDEIVVSDDCSTEANLEIIKRFPVDQLITAEKNRGLASNINKGISHCKGRYILYCQEDFLLKPELGIYLNKLTDFLDTSEVDMVRIKCYISFKKMNSYDGDFSIIPTFSWSNFYTNPNRYSDHPYIVKKEFYDKFGIYLDDTSGHYGETEYAIRLANARAKIGMTKDSLSTVAQNSDSVIVNEVGHKPQKVNLNKKTMRFLRAVRLYLEWTFYSKKNRGLITYTNFRKST